MTTITILERVVVPLVSAYALFVGMVVYGWRHRVPTPPPRSLDTSNLGAYLRHIALTAAGGYVVFLAIVLIFHVAIAGQRGAFRSALAGGAFLAFAVAVPVFAAGGWVSHRFGARARARRPPG